MSPATINQLGRLNRVQVNQRLNDDDIRYTSHCIAISEALST